MKLFYYSGTGNSLAVAKRICFLYERFKTSLPIYYYHMCRYTWWYFTSAKKMQNQEVT